jgi:hypothetical protein
MHAVTSWNRTALLNLFISILVSKMGWKKILPRLLVMATARPWPVVYKKAYQGCRWRGHYATFGLSYTKKTYQVRRWWSLRDLWPAGYKKAYQGCRCRGHYATFGLSYTKNLTKAGGDGHYATFGLPDTKSLPRLLVMVTTPLLACRIQKKLTKTAGDGHCATFGLLDTKKT